MYAIANALGAVVRDEHGEPLVFNARDVAEFYLDATIRRLPGTDGFTVVLFHNVGGVTYVTAVPPRHPYED